MDWDKTINTVGEVSRKAFTLALAAVLILIAVTGTYIAGLAAWWLVRRIQEALGA
jgi:hypothetical protein